MTLFNELSSQWRMGPHGATGLDYNVLYRKMDRMRLSDADCEALEDDIRTLEDAALTKMREGKQ